MTRRQPAPARGGTRFAALAVLTGAGLWAQQAAPVEVSAPAAPAQAGPAADGPRVRPAEILEEQALGPAWIEGMNEVLRRQAELGPENEPGSAGRNGAQGEWEVPGMRWCKGAHSGTKHLINRWGDTALGIGFGAEVDLVGAWIAGQGTFGSWTDGLQAIGYRDGEEVARSAWFEEIGATPAWFEIGLEDVDRVVLVARPVLEGSGWYALDDLTFEVTPADGGEEVVVLDFEDLPHRTRLTGSGYAGLRWEVGTGDFVQPAQEMPPPQVPPGTDLESEVGGGAAGAAKLGGGGTTPRRLRDFDGPRFGDAGCCWLPPDTCGSVGPAHFVAVTNVNLSVFLKATGQRVVDVSLAAFWGENVGDPRVAYDPHEDRWAILAMTGPTVTGRVYFAYSLTGDPSGAWFKSYIDTAQGPDAGSWPDYPTLGLDARGIYTAALMVGGNTMSLFAIDKAPLLAGTPTMGTVSAWRQLPWEGAIQPCVTYGDSGGVYLVSRRSSSTLRLRQVTGPLTAPALVQAGIVAVPSHGSPPDAPQKGTIATLDSSDFRPMNAVYRDGSVWTAHSVSVAGRAAVRWYEIDAASATAIQVGTVSDPSLHFYMPGISVNATHDMVVGFTGSDESTYAGAWLTGRRATDSPGVTGPPLLYKAGLGPYTQVTATGTNRWGDYSLTSVDPLDDETFWTIQEYARADNTWATHIAEADFGCTVSSYCSAKISSNLCAPQMSASGLPSLSLSDFFLISVTGMEIGVNGIMFFGLTGKAANPFQGGTLCVAPPVYRLPIRNSGGTSTCTGSFGYSLKDLLSAPVGGPQIGVGSLVTIQAWSRDVADPFGTSLSDGLSFETCP